MCTREKKCHFIKDVPVNMHGMEGVTDFPIIVKFDSETNTITDAVTGEEYKGTIWVTDSYTLSVMLGDKLYTNEVSRWEDLLRETYGVEKYFETMEFVRATLNNLQKDLDAPKRKLEAKSAIA